MCNHIGQAWQGFLHLGPAAEAHVLICGLHKGVGQRVLQPLLVCGCTVVSGTQCPHMGVAENCFSQAVSISVPSLHRSTAVDTHDNRVFPYH